MKQIVYTRKRCKLAQEKDCECKEFYVYKNKNNDMFVECVKCKTRYNVEKIEERKRKFNG